MGNKPAYLLTIILNSLLSILLIIEAYFSLGWRMVHDSPILYYMGYLVARFGAIPYKDFFDMNMPGAHWINALSGIIFGFSDRGFQTANLLILLSILILIFLWLRSFNYLAAWTGSIIFGLFFFHYGPAMSMQREFLTLPFILGALIFYPTEKNLPVWRYFLAGLLVGLSILIKPQSGLILLVFPFLELLIFQESEEKPKLHLNWKKISLFLLGLALPLISMFLYFFTNQAAGSFFEIAFKYWPLYNKINARLEINPTANPIIEMINGVKSLGANSLWLLPVIISIFIFQKNNQSRQNMFKIRMLICGVVISLIEVIIANKYWDYHWLPMLFFLILISSCGLVYLRQSSKWVWLLPISIFIVFFFLVRPEKILFDHFQSVQQTPPQIGRVEKIADYLQKNLEPGDTVQPLDWSNGAVQAMLIARAKPATRYLYDFYFYHDISNPEIKFIRKDLIGKMEEVKPKIIIQFFEDRPWVDGYDTTRDFPELEQFLMQHYYIDYERDGFRLWMRNN